MAASDKAEKARRRITFRRVTMESDGLSRAPIVFCPRKHSLMSVVECSGCDRFAGLCISSVESDTFLRCAVDAQDASAAGGGSESHPSADPSNPARTPIQRIMTSSVCSTTPDTSLQDLTSLFLAEHVSALPVVDADQRLVGIVTKTDAMERYYDHTEAVSLAQAGASLGGEADSDDLPALDADVTVRDVMTRAVFSMSAASAVGRVAALMAYEQVHHVVIVGDTGAVCGIVSTLDIARWVASCDGYIVPSPTRIRQ